MRYWIYYGICFLFIMITSDLVGKYDADLFNGFWYLRILQVLAIATMWIVANQIKNY